MGATQRIIKLLPILILALTIITACSNPTNDTPQLMTEEESNIITETNSVRTNPKGYAAMLQAELQSIGSSDTIAKYNAAIATLNAVEPRDPLKFEMGLYLAACYHADDLIKTNIFSHTSSDGTSFVERLKRYCKSYNSIGENIAGGTNQNTGAKVVKQWVLSPGHLNNMLNAGFTQIGAALKSGHPTYNWIGVQNFGRGFVSN